MTRIWKTGVLAALFSCGVMSVAHSFEFGPRPLFTVLHNEQTGRYVSGLYSYQLLNFNAFTLWDSRSRAETVNDPVSEYQPHHHLAVSTNLLFGLDLAVNYLTNQFNQNQENALPYDEFKITANFANDAYFGYRRVTQRTRTTYEVAPLRHEPNSRIAELEYDTTIDVVKLGLIQMTPFFQGEESAIAAQGYIGLTYLGLRTAVPGFDGLGNLMAVPFNSQTLGFSINLASIYMPRDTQLQDNFIPYYTLGMALTLGGVGIVNDEWVYGFGTSLTNNDSAYDGSFEIGAGAFVMGIARIDAMFFFDGIRMRSGSYEQLLGKLGFGITVEIQL